MSAFTPVARPLAVCAALLAIPVAPRAQGSGDTGIAPWAAAVSASTAASTRQVSRQLRGGRYMIRFTIAPNGAASDFAIVGSRREPAQYALLTGALALTNYPPPPDGRSHTVMVPIHVHGARRARP